MKKPFVTAAILAAGLSSRTCSTQTKQTIKICGKSVVRRAVELFDSLDLIDDIIVVVRREEEDFTRQELSGIRKPYKLVYGGSSRAESAKNAFLALNPLAEFISIHDAARCITAASDIEKVINDAFIYGAASAARKVSDTVKETDGGGFIKKTLDRNSLRFVETPQVFRVELYKKALSSSEYLDASVTDDNMLVERIGERVFLTEFEKENLKITTPRDILYAEFLLKGDFGDE